MCSVRPHGPDDNQPNTPQSLLLWRGTDIDSFSKTEESGGKVVSLAIDKYIHVLVNKRFDERVRVSYSSLELVDDFEDLKHELVREAMRLTRSYFRSRDYHYRRYTIKRHRTGLFINGDSRTTECPAQICRS